MSEDSSGLRDTQAVRTFRKKIAEDRLKIGRLDVAHWLELLGICDLNVRSKVVSSEANLDTQVFVTEDGLFLAENWIGESRVEGRNVDRPIRTGAHHRQFHGFSGERGPYLC